MTSREHFEAWMTAEQWFHGSDFEWDERRNCYAQFGIHLAYKAFLAAEGAAEQKLTDMAVQLANAESKCRELAAENACLKQSIEEVAEAFETGTDGVLATAVDESLNLLTPETDAVLKRIQAQGVDMFADSLLCPDLDDSIREFAAQLRKGAEL
ncbi:hypothetical protein [Citrobacter werkmanii]|uniref:hypothetical protein n=1 Tax=Citrobacter werkmanii TaxID=67827 RepID=UPI00351CE495